MPTAWQNLTGRLSLLAQWPLISSYADTTGNGYTLNTAGSPSPQVSQPGLIAGEADTSTLFNGSANCFGYAGPISGLIATAGSIGGTFQSFGGGTQTLVMIGTNGFGIYLDAQSNTGKVVAVLNTDAGAITVYGPQMSAGSIFTAFAAYSVSGTTATFTLTVNGIVYSGTKTITSAAYVMASDNYFRIGLSTGLGLFTGYAEKILLSATCFSADTIAVLSAFCTAVTGVPPTVPFFGNAAIAKRLLTGRMRALMIGDSIMVRTQAAILRCLPCQKITGFFTGVAVSQDDQNYGVQLQNQTVSGITAATPSPNDLTSTFTEATGSAPAGNSNSTLLAFATVPSAWNMLATLHNGDFIREADSRNVQLTAEMMVCGNTTSGDGANFFMAGMYDNVQQVPTIGAQTYIPANVGNGTWQKTSVTYPTNIPPSGLTVGLRMPSAATMNNGKTIKFLNYLHITTGENGFEFGSLALGGSSLDYWAATYTGSGTSRSFSGVNYYPGIYPDANIAALCTLGNVDTFMVSLGTNGETLGTGTNGIFSNGAYASVTEMATGIANLMARFRAIVPGAAFIFFSPYELTANYGNSRLSMYDSAYRQAVANDPIGNSLYLDTYHAIGPYQKNFPGLLSSSQTMQPGSYGAAVVPASVSETNGVVTMVLASNPLNGQGLNVGVDYVTVAGFTGAYAGYNGTFVVQSFTGGNTITYNAGATGLGSTSATSACSATFLNPYWNTFMQGGDSYVTDPEHPSQIGISRFAEILKTLLLAAAWWPGPAAVKAGGGFE